MNSGIKSFCLKPFMVSQDQVYIISPYLLAKVKILNRQRRKAHASCWYTTCVCFPSRKKELQTIPVEIIYLPFQQTLNVSVLPRQSAESSYGHWKLPELYTKVRQWTENHGWYEFSFTSQEWFAFVPTLLLTLVSLIGI